MAQLPRRLCTCRTHALRSQEPQVLCNHQATHASPSPLVGVPLWVQLPDPLSCRTVGYQTRCIDPSQRCLPSWRECLHIGYVMNWFSDPTKVQEGQDRQGKDIMDDCQGKAL